MASIETDYLIIGAGAVGLAFADTLLEETDAEMVIVDRRGKPGGHWNDAYSFVALHQPSAYYGVNSLPLGSDQKDTWGVNKGLYELASGAEVSAYFDRVMRQRLLASGRVRYLPMSEWREGEGVISLLSGARTAIEVRKKTVDATWFGTTIPATHTPRFAIGDGVRCVPPNALPQLWQKPDALPQRFVIVGAGKTAMDAVGWLLAAGAPPDTISWVMPRDSWLLNRLKTQPGLEFFEETMGGQLALMEAYASATSVDDLFLRLEQSGVVLRIHPDRTPTMFHYATISTAEVDVLRTVTDVIRMGRVVAISANGMELEHGTVPVDGATTLYVDCSASAVEDRPTVPVFDGARITPQLLRVPQPSFSAALIAWVEAHGTTDADKNALCTPIRLPRRLQDYPAASFGNMMNQFAWSQNKPLRQWLRESRLDGFSKVIAEVAPDDTARLNILNAMRTTAPRAAANLQGLAAAAL